MQEAKIPVAPENWLLRPAGWVGLAAILPIVLAIHLFAAAVTIRHSNQDSTASDQGAEMWLAATSRQDVLPQRTDGVRHPLWSWTARHLYTEDAAAFFTRGKWLNTAICVVFLAALGAAASRWLDPLALANLLLLSSLGILLVRGTYFQPEPLYYIFSFLAIVLGWRLLGGGALWHWAIFGVICGLAYLSKPSLAPLLIVFCAAFALRWVLALKSGEWSLWGNAGGLALALGILGVMLVPLALFSASHFGKPLFSYTKYWMWMDDFEKEAWPFQGKYPGGVQLKTLPPEETPSVGWYFRRHTVGDAFGRLSEGMQGVTVRFFFPEPKLKAGNFFWRKDGKKWEQPLSHRGIYLFALAALVIGLAIVSRETLGSVVRSPDAWARAAFVLMLAGIYIGLYGWYWPIGKGDRFMGSLWIPCVFLLMWLAWALRERAASLWGGRAYLAVQAAVLVSVLLQVAAMFWKFQQGVFLVTKN
jgi:hypothetical protein